MTGTPSAEEAIELALERRPRSVRQLQLVTGIPRQELRAALDVMARHGKVRVRPGLAGIEIVPVGNN